VGAAILRCNSFSGDVSGSVKIASIKSSCSGTIRYDRSSAANTMLMAGDVQDPQAEFLMSREAAKVN
jgi:hypothetical protein